MKCKRLFLIVLKIQAKTGSDNIHDISKILNIKNWMTWTILGWWAWKGWSSNLPEIWPQALTHTWQPPFMSSLARTRYHPLLALSTGDTDAGHVCGGLFDLDTALWHKACGWTHALQPSLQSHAHVPMYPCIYVHTHICIPVHTHSPMHRYVHVHTYTGPHKPTHVHLHIYSYALCTHVLQVVRTCLHTSMYMHTQYDTRICTYTCHVHADTCTR